jgi:eukaryotic-like serine/threonine-protein kinase
MVEQFSPLQNGTILQNRYQITNLLGKGGMGAVYCALHLELNIQVAIKQIILTGDDDFITAFKQEAKLLAILNHEAIPSVTDYFDENDYQFFVMELIDGEDLMQKLKRFQQNGRRTLPFAEVFEICLKLLDVLDYLHSNNIIHRDIKPANVKIDDKGNLKLIDFGVAKGSLHPTQDYATLLKGGTKNYSSPEQLKEEKTDQRSDIYSLGATIYRLLSGIVPPDSLNERAIKIAVGEADPLYLLSDINSEIPKQFAEIIKQAMNLDLNKRFNSAKEMKCAIINLTPSEQSIEPEIDTVVRPRIKELKRIEAEFFFQQAEKETNLIDKIKLYTQAIYFDSQFAEAYNARGLSYFENKDYESAIRDFAKAMKLDGKYSDNFHKTKNWIIKNTKDFTSLS